MLILPSKNVRDGKAGTKEQKKRRWGENTTDQEEEEHGVADILLTWPCKPGDSKQPQPGDIRILAGPASRLLTKALRDEHYNLMAAFPVLKDVDVRERAPAVQEAREASPSKQLCLVRIRVFETPASSLNLRYQSPYDLLAS